MVSFSFLSETWCLSSVRARAHWPLCLATGGRVFVARIFIPVGNHYFQALASTLQFVAQVCDRLWLVPATDRAFAYITHMSPPHVALVCSGPPQKRGHMWLNKVASVLGPLRTGRFRLSQNLSKTYMFRWSQTMYRNVCWVLVSLVFTDLSLLLKYSFFSPKPLFCYDIYHYLANLS